MRASERVEERLDAAHGLVEVRLIGAAPGQQQGGRNELRRGREGLPERAVSPAGTQQKRLRLLAGAGGGQQRPHLRGHPVEAAVHRRAERGRVPQRSGVRRAPGGCQPERARAGEDAALFKILRPERLLVCKKPVHGSG